MAHFTDRDDREWEMTLDDRARDALRPIVGFLHPHCRPERLIQRLADDPRKLASAIYAILEPQIIERGMTTQEFVERVLRHSHTQATQCLMEAITDYLLTVASDAAAVALNN